MLENIPISGLAICYGPLALTIIGFIVFATLTDADARRTYLRRLDPRTEDEVEEEQPLTVERPFTASTPSGGIVTITPADESTSGPANAYRADTGFREGDAGSM